MTATRPLPTFTSFSRLARTVASEPASPSTKTLVLSHTMASAPSSPMRRSIASSVTSPSSGSGSIFQSPVWNTVPSLRADRQRIGLEDRMRHGDQLELERRQAELAAERDLGDRHRRRRRPASMQLAPQHRGGERRGIDRRLRAAARGRRRRPDDPRGRGSARCPPGPCARSSMKAGSGMTTSTPGVESSAKPMPRSTISHLPAWP